ncbi:DUF202 domain-containing protein [Vibrio crassostreae]|uniref:DUF202 domain-containing protein n=1 Tax=Vibrio crassostreae TaxID=246167 RepID=UPI002062517F|nr:DUF202 domain-containing protein [Vibrio crassostreae]
MIRDKGLQPERTAMSWLRTQLVLFGAGLLLLRTYFVYDHILLALSSLIGIVLTFCFSTYIQLRFRQTFTDKNAITKYEYVAKFLLSATVSLLALCYAIFSLMQIWKII